MLTAPRKSTPPRIVIADDSSFMRRLLAQALTEGGFEVVGQAADGDEALELFRRLRPDAMTLDLAMPGLDGIGVLRALRAEWGRRSIPVVVVSAFSPDHGARAVDALAEGAFDLVAKPAFGEPLEQFVATLRDKVNAAVAIDEEHAAPVAVPAPVAVQAPPPPAPPEAATSDRVVVIASSTGGPRALSVVVPALPRMLGSGGLIIQHMPAGFTASLAERLNKMSAIRVVEATDGERLRSDTLLLAPGGSHLRLRRGGRSKLSDEDAIGGLRPRADLTIMDAARLYGDRLLLVVLTGMGKDGLEGARQVRARGGRIIVEAPSTCTVYGMPRAIAEAGLANEILPLDQIAAAITREVA